MANRINCHHCGVEGITPHKNAFATLKCPACGKVFGQIPSDTNKMRGLMKVKYGGGKTEFGPGVLIKLTGDEVAIAIDAYLVAHRVHVSGPRTITVNGELCQEGEIYVDPSGQVIHNGKLFSGRGHEEKAD